MTRLTRAARSRAAKLRLPLIAASAAVLLGGCVVPGGMTGGGESSRLASDASCPSDAALGARFEQPVDPAAVDAGLLTEALRQLVNQARCERGATPLALSPAAVQAAQGETLQQRIRAENGRFGYAAENVARAATTMLDADGCLGTTAAGASPTYADLARGLFDMWIVSSKHSDNMLNPNYRQVGAGIGVNPQKYRCGEIAAAMVFIG